MAKKLASEIPRCALTPAEAAASIGCGVDHFDEFVRPHLRLVRSGRKVFIQITELERWLSENAEPPTNDIASGGSR